MRIFSLLKTAPDCAARRGVLHLPHAPAVPTPVFMPVGTQGTVKAMTFEELAELRFRLILGNTFHLYLRPGSDRIARFGGLHEFIGWDGAMPKPRSSLPARWKSTRVMSKRVSTVGWPCYARGSGTKHGRTS